MFSNKEISAILSTAAKVALEQLNSEKKLLATELAMFQDMVNRFAIRKARYDWEVERGICHSPIKLQKSNYLKTEVSFHDLLVMALSCVKVKVDNSLDFACYSKDAGIILKEDSGLKTLAHEVVHFLQHNEYPVNQDSFSLSCRIKAEEIFLENVVVDHYSPMQEDLEVPAICGGLRPVQVYCMLAHYAQENGIKVETNIISLKDGRYKLETAEVLCSLYDDDEEEDTTWYEDYEDRLEVYCEASNAMIQVGETLYKEYPDVRYDPTFDGYVVNNWVVRGDDDVNIHISPIDNPFKGKYYEPYEAQRLLSS